MSKVALFFCMVVFAAFGVETAARASDAVTVSPQTGIYAGTTVTVTAYTSASDFSTLVHCNQGSYVVYSSWRHNEIVSTYVMSMNQFYDSGRTARCSASLWIKTDGQSKKTFSVSFNVEAV